MSGEFANGVAGGGRDGEKRPLARLSFGSGASLTLLLWGSKCSCRLWLGEQLKRIFCVMVVVGGFSGEKKAR